jgi:phosphate transporter
MKFSHTLSLNANPDWAEHYIDYASLKKLIKESAAVATVDEEILVQESQTKFLQKLMEMVTTVREFYYKTLGELNQELARLKPILEKSASYLDLAEAAAADATEDTSLLRSRKLKSLTTIKEKSGTDSNNDSNLEQIRREICDMFTQYHDLQTYAQLNCTAVRKILKKYDKQIKVQQQQQNDNNNNHPSSLQETELKSFRAMLPFWDNGTPEIDHAMDILKQYFAHFFCHDDTGEALRQLNLMVREVVTFHRRSVWLDVIKDQRRYESAQMVDPSKQLAAPIDQVLKGPGTIWQHIRSSVTLQIGLFGVALFVYLLFSPDIFPGDATKQNGLALLVFVSLLWAAEVTQLFVTAMLVPFLAVTLRVIVIDGVRLDAISASKHVFASMFSHVIMLLIGGFSIAAALTKYNIAKLVASSIALRCGSGIRIVLLVYISVATIASMWISNVAAPVLCYSLIAPILNTTTAETSRAAFGSKQQESAERDHRLCRALVMGIALASNVGGMASPISSPQNLFAIEYTPIGWVAWFTVSIPLCILLDLLIWAWLIYCFQLPSADSSVVARALQRNRFHEEHFTATQYYVMIVSVGVVLLWCASVSLENQTGQMGVLGIVPFVLFFGTNTLTKEDLNNFLWSVVILAMGGLVLGEAVESSGLLDVMAENIAWFIEENSLSLWATMSIFTFLILVWTTFTSHTVGAIIVLPILNSVGSQMEPSRAKELVFVGALACSAAMGLPVSGFPNMTAVSQEDHIGNRFLTTNDFLKYAVPASIFSWAVIVSIGFALILVAVHMES